MHTSSFLLAATAFAATVSAAPAPSPFGNLLGVIGDSIGNTLGDFEKAIQSFNKIQHQDAVQPESTLPKPTTELKWIVLGMGTQNYSCGSDSSASPRAVGAVADLYDLTPWFSNSIVQKNPDEVYKQATCLANKYDNNAGLRRMGKHYFTAAGVPTFDLSTVRAYLSCGKKANVNAPADACKGRSGAAAVPWLYLTDVGGSKLVSSVYRLETVGGSAQSTCAGKENQAWEVDYAAEYWFYA